MAAEEEEEVDRDVVLARQVAEEAWGSRGELSAVHVGLNRLTWKVGQDLWLTEPEPIVDLSAPRWPPIGSANTGGFARSSLATTGTGRRSIDSRNAFDQ